MRSSLSSMWSIFCSLRKMSAAGFLRLKMPSTNY